MDLLLTASLKLIMSKKIRMKREVLVFVGIS